MKHPPLVSVMGRHRIVSVPYLGCVLFLVVVTLGAQVTRLDIEDALMRALRSSEELKYARLEYKFEGSRYDLSLREFLPAITVGYTQDDAVAYYAPDSHLKKLSVGIDQLLYAGGARIHERRILKHQLRIRNRSIEQIEKELRLQVMNRYVEIIKLGLQLVMLGESLAMARDQVTIAAEELELGEITRLDFIDIELAVQDLEIELAVLEQEEDRLEFELKELLHIPPINSLELIGGINPDFRGMLPNEYAQYYIDCATKNNLDLRKQTAEITALADAVKQARGSWLPRMSTQVELSVVGERFPLTDPGFLVGVNLDFSAPLVPFRTGLTAGSRRLEERSLGLSSSAELGENLLGWQSLRIARIALQKAETKMQKVRRTLEYSILQQLKTRSFLLDSLRLEEKKIDLQEQRRSIEALMLEIGEITRLEYLQSGIALARQRIDQLSRIVRLFQLEAMLLAECGSDMLERSHRYILSIVAEELL
jgi:outer membrane protein TolC